MYKINITLSKYSAGTTKAKCFEVYTNDFNEDQANILTSYIRKLIYLDKNIEETGAIMTKKELEQFDVLKG